LSLQIAIAGGIGGLFAANSLIALGISFILMNKRPLPSRSVQARQPIAAG
jgi:succinate dehydrogenase/fumarate reductase flavoprotein subunit